jgi:hypothetical protein
MQSIAGKTHVLNCHCFIQASQYSRNLVTMRSRNLSPIIVLKELP